MRENFSVYMVLSCRNSQNTCVNQSNRNETTANDYNEGGQSYGNNQEYIVIHPQAYFHQNPIRTAGKTCIYCMAQKYLSQIFPPSGMDSGNMEVRTVWNAYGLPITKVY